MIDVLATEPHFRAHLQPVYDAMPARLRGRWATRPDELVPGRLVLAAAYGDMKRARRRGHQVVLAEHGAGQSYTGSTSGSYIGAPDRDGVVAVLVPGPDAAARHTAAHPDIPAHVVGCPRMDRWHTQPPRVRGDQPVVAISFHWDCRVVPETRSAWRVYRRYLEPLARAFPGVIGHGHPRIIDQLLRDYGRQGIEIVRDFDEVLQRADCYVVDNSSTLYEFASLDRPTVALNAPWYRRDVDHGLRFWDGIPGLQLSNPKLLATTVRRALDDSPDLRLQRQLVTCRVYAFTDGTAARQAVAAIEGLHDRSCEASDDASCSAAGDASSSATARRDASMLASRDASPRPRRDASRRSSAARPGRPSWGATFQ